MQIIATYMVVSIFLGILFGIASMITHFDYPWLGRLAGVFYIPPLVLFIVGAVAYALLRIWEFE